MSTTTTIPHGYKMTEVGAIPKNWQVVCLGELGAFSKGVGIKKNEVIDDGLPCVRYGEIYTHHSEVIKEFHSHIPAEIAMESQKLKQGDLLFASSGETAEEIGKCTAFIGNELAFAGGDIVIFSPRNSNSRFLSCLMNSPLLVRQKTRMAQGDAIVHISARNLAKLCLPLPDTREQQAIAEALADADVLIEAQEQLIAKKRDIKLATMQQLLSGQMRLPSFDRSRGRSRKLDNGVVPSDWDVKSYGDLFDFLPTANNSRADLTVDGDVGYIHYGDIHTKWDNFIVFSKARSPCIDAKLVRNASLIREGDLIVADASEDYAGIAKSIEVRNLGNHKAVAGLHTYLLREKAGALVNGFKGYIHNIKAVKTAIDRVATGLKVYGVSKNNLKDVLIPVPSKDEQEAIVQVLSDMDSEIASLEAEREKTKALKQGMMQELLTGRTRLI